MKYTELTDTDKEIISKLNLDDLINIETITKTALENNEDNLEIVIKIINYITKLDIKQMNKNDAIQLINKYSILKNLLTLEWDSEEEEFTIDNNIHSLKRFIMKDEMSFGTYASLLKEFENKNSSENIKAVIAYMIDYNIDKSFDEKNYSLINKIPLHIVMSFVSFFLSNLELYNKVMLTYSQLKNTEDYHQTITSMQNMQRALESTQTSGNLLKKIQLSFINFLNSLSLRVYFFSISTIIKIRQHITTRNLKKVKSK